jgi:hypothetical protein
MEKKEPVIETLKKPKVEVDVPVEEQELTELQIKRMQQAAMLNAFFRIHDFLVAHAVMPIRRLLMDEINWDDRLIAIKGGRGVGKTDFLLSRVKEIETEWAASQDPETKKRKSKKKKVVRPCLYVSFNDFYFTENSLMD